MAAKPVPPTVVQPVVQTLVVRYAKRGRMRFASHRDVARAFERGVFRAGLPIAYSAGFSPHPKISYVGGAPTGVASEAEYLKIGLTSASLEAHDVRDRLDAMLPDGIDVMEVTTAAEGFAEPEASLWLVVLPDVPEEAARQAVAAFLERTEAPVERLTDKGVRKLDARGAVASLTAGLGDRRGEVTSVLRIVILHQSPAVRPEDVLTALRADGLPAAAGLTTRLEQGLSLVLSGQTVP